MINYVLQMDTVAEKFLTAIAYIAAILFAIIIHEYAHGYIAYINGDMTAKMMGRLSFNPVVHFNLYGILMFIFVGFGWANPVPINPNNFKNYKKGMLSTSVAGVAANFLTAFICAGLLSLIILASSKLDVNNNSFIYLVVFLFSQFFLISIIVNISLIAFNILPIFPLDGFRLVETLSRKNNAYVQLMRRYGMFILLGLVILSNILGNINPKLDFFSMYMYKIQELILKFFNLIFSNYSLLD